MTTLNSRSPAPEPVVRRWFARPGEAEQEPLFRMWTDADATVFLSGGLDGESVAQVRAFLKDRDAGERVVVDVSGLHFIDSSGLGLLLAQDDRMRRNGGVLVLRGPGPALRRVFEVTGATGRFTIEPLS